MQNSQLGLVQLLHLADSALPVGSSAHSFGMETLAQEGHLWPENIGDFMASYVEEIGRLEGVFCRQAHECGQDYLPCTDARPNQEWQQQWSRLNQSVAATKVGRESREASNSLGRRLLRLVASLEPLPGFHEALQTDSGLYFCTAFGLIGGLLAFDVDQTVQAYLHQSVAGLLSACQRLMPVGQHLAASTLWKLKPAIVHAATSPSDGSNGPMAFTPLLDIGSMRHPNQPVRLFIS